MALALGALGVIPACVCGGESLPVAVIVGPSTARVGETVTLDGSGSSEPDGRMLYFNWRILTVPAGSSGVALNDRGRVRPSFVPDVPGLYTVELFVATESLRSDPRQHDVTVSMDGPDGAMADGGIDIDASPQDAGATDASATDAGACGALDQACCVGATECGAGLVCMGFSIRTCVAGSDASAIVCGGVGQGCCPVAPPGEPCDPGLVCVGTVADSMCAVPTDAGPVSCGMNGELCCASMPYCVTGLTCRSHLPLPSRCQP